MSFQIQQGLFSSDFTDHYAILGISVDADAKEIRKRYLKIARRLHPDSLSSDSEDEKQKASEFLSKLVNPAYEKLSQEREFTEYAVVLRLKGQQALRQQETIVLVSEQARQLATTGNVDQTYKSSLKELADKQYESLDETLDIIGLISELNLVYLMRKGDQGDVKLGQSAKQSPPGASETTSTTRSPSTTRKPSAPPPRPESIVEAYLRRAQEFETKQAYAKAILELRDALKVEPNNSVCHSRLGVVYLKTNQPTMAKIHFNQALKLNPQDSVALEGKRRVDPTTGDSAAGNQGAKGKGSAASKGDQSDKPRGGLFGLFGGKKK